MDMSSSGRERFSRVARGIAIAAVVAFIIAVAIIVIGNRQNMMLGGINAPYFSDSRVQKNSGVVGMGVPSPMGLPGSEIAPSIGRATDNGTLPQTEDVAPAEKKVVKTGDLTLKVESVEKAMDQLRGIAAQFEGDIFSSSIYDAKTANSIKQGQATIKVSAAHFDEAMQSIKSIARVVVRETTNGQDVTSQYVDLQARLKNKQVEEESIAAILTRDSNNIDDVLQVTTQLARVRGEIEQLQAQMKYLDNQSDMSTIAVSFTEDTKIGKTDTDWRPLQEIKAAVNALIKAGQGAISFLISFVIVVVPILGIFLLIFGGILYVVVKKLHQWLRQ
ncbi:MAG: DUF4349 domain-containing protein [Candidatus Moranbacteria bacterium]|nr:DUF4349 domain-containing protein [Candidatus Moranbacteria bacterium]